jgi:hypothetical protein
MWKKGWSIRYRRFELISLWLFGRRVWGEKRTAFSLPIRQRNMFWALPPTRAFGLILSRAHSKMPFGYSPGHANSLNLALRAPKFWSPTSLSARKTNIHRQSKP